MNYLLIVLIFPFRHSNDFFANGGTGKREFWKWYSEKVVICPEQWDRYLLSIGHLLIKVHSFKSIP